MGTLTQAGMGASLGVSKHDMGTIRHGEHGPRLGQEPHCREEVLSFEKHLAYSTSKVYGGYETKVFILFRS